MLTTSVEPDLALGVIRVSLRGTLTLESAPTARTVLLKCFAQAPDAVIVDVSDLRVESRSRLTVFPAAARVHTEPVVGLVLCGPSEDLRALMSGGVLGTIPVYDSYQHAVAAVADAVAAAARRVNLRMAPTLDAPMRARHLVEEACRSWGISHLTGPATLVISELVSNAVEHAGTGIQVSASFRGNYLHLNVRDGDPRPPVAAATVDVPDGDPLPVRGRGLYLVDVYTAAWGSLTAERGKTVWATLRATPVAGSRASAAPA